MPDCCCLELLRALRSWLLSGLVLRVIALRELGRGFTLLLLGLILLRSTLLAGLNTA
jgi:hypothetical protein